MNTRMVQLLILKDWYFHRWVIAGYLGVGAVGLLLTATGGEGAFYAGSILLITVLIGLGLHLTMGSVVEERVAQTLPFVMSLPISFRDYTTSKILSNVVLFLVPWTALIIGSIVVILGRDGVPDGLLPFTVLLQLQILSSYCLLLAVALISESQVWAIVATVVTNLGFQGFLYWTSHAPDIAENMKGSAVIWSGTAGVVALIEIVAIALLLVSTYVLQSRKKDFL